MTDPVKVSGYDSPIILVSQYAKSIRCFVTLEGRFIIYDDDSIAQMVIPSERELISIRAIMGEGMSEEYAIAEIMAKGE